MIRWGLTSSLGFSLVSLAHREPCEETLNLTHWIRVSSTDWHPKLAGHAQKLCVWHLNSRRQWCTMCRDAATSTSIWSAPSNTTTRTLHLPTQMRGGVTKISQKLIRESCASRGKWWVESEGNGVSLWSASAQDELSALAQTWGKLKFRNLQRGEKPD